MKLPQLLTENPFPTPQLPERMVWTSSSVSLWRACKRKWFWKYIMGIRPKRGDKNLAIGKAFHATLGEWYRSKRSDMSLIAARYAVQLDEFASEQTDYYDQEEYDKLVTAVRTFQGMMQGYAAVYCEDRAKWRIRRDCIEKQFLVKFEHFDYAGMIDLVYGPQSFLEICEHKTASVVNDVYIDRLTIDTQARGYVMGAREGLSIPVKRVNYDIVKKCKLRKKSGETQEDFNKRIADDYLARPEFYFHREPLTYNQGEISALKWELHQVHQEYVDLTKGPWSNPQSALYSLGEAIGLPLTGPEAVIHPRWWPINDRNCNAYFKLCEYHMLCTHGVDKGTMSTYRHEPNLHEELAVEEEAE